MSTYSGLGTGSLNIVPPVVQPTIDPVANLQMAQSNIDNMQFTNNGLEPINTTTNIFDPSQLATKNITQSSVFNPSQGPAEKVNVLGPGAKPGGLGDVFNMDNVLKLGELGLAAYLGNRQLTNTETQMNNNIQKYRAKLATDKSRKGSMVGNSNAGKEGHETTIAANDYELDNVG